MKEIYVPLIEDIDLYINDVDGFLIGIEGFSENFNYLVKLEELKEIISLINKNNKKSFICLNRLYFNSEIDSVKELINNIKDLDITGICYSDMGVLNILNELNYNKEIMHYSLHTTTNSKTLNFLEKRNVTYSVLSTEITKEEIIKISNNTNIKTGVILYGYLNMATSSRKLLTNYFEYIDKDKIKDKYNIKDKISNEEYFLVEKKNTNFFTNKVLNGIKFYPDILKSNISFIILDNYMLDLDKFLNVIKAFKNINNKSIEELEQEVISNTDKDTFYGFLDKKTVYKVEDYE